MKYNLNRRILKELIIKITFFFQGRQDGNGDVLPEVARASNFLSDNNMNEKPSGLLIIIKAE